MEKRLKICLQAGPNLLPNLDKLQAFKKELQEKGLGYVDDHTLEIVCDDNDVEEVMALFKKYTLGK
ncbi:MAG: hypothetical protein LUC86_07735 [Prevotellaceae bacterium]|nr:hypothetical protein [Prevotellaceae bacterium]